MSNTRIARMHTIVTSIILSFAFSLMLLAGCNRNSTNLIESTGTIEATEVDIRAEASGTIVALNFDEGDWVKRGDILADIDHEKLDIELARAKARLAEADAQLSRCSLRA